MIRLYEGVVEVTLPRRAVGRLPEGEACDRPRRGRDQYARPCA
jgi:hypothetical protein